MAASVPATIAGTFDNVVSTSGASGIALTTETHRPPDSDQPFERRFLVVPPASGTTGPAALATPS